MYQDSKKKSKSTDSKKKTDSKKSKKKSDTKTDKKSSGSKDKKKQGGFKTQIPASMKPTAAQKKVRKKLEKQDLNKVRVVFFYSFCLADILDIAQD